MKQQHAGKASPHTPLYTLGFVATIWWGISCGFVALILIRATSYYAALSAHSGSMFIAADWVHATTHSYEASDIFMYSSLAIVVIWVAGFGVWLIALTRASIPISAGLHDLFLRIRK
jgi:hypothetical protein